MDKLLWKIDNVFSICSCCCCCRCRRRRWFFLPKCVHIHLWTVFGWSKITTYKAVLVWSGRFRQTRTAQVHVYKQHELRIGWVCCVVLCSVVYGMDAKCAVAGKIMPVHLINHNICLENFFTVSRSFRCLLFYLSENCVHFFSFLLLFHLCVGIRVRVRVFYIGCVTIFFLHSQPVSFIRFGACGSPHFRMFWGGFSDSSFIHPLAGWHWTNV